MYNLKKKKMSSQRLKKIFAMYLMVIMVANVLTFIPMNIVSETGSPPPGAGNSKGGGPYNSTGDWVIQNGDDITRIDQEIILKGNLTIENGGKLTFKNVTLKMDCSYDGEFQINVESGGSFYILENPIPGDLDLFSGDQNGNVRFYENTGDSNAPNFPQRVNVKNSGGSNIDIEERSNIDLADLDGDGDYDLFVGDGDDTGSSILFYRNTGSVTSPVWMGQGRVKDNTGSNIGIGSNAAPCFADLNNDGDFDLVIGEWDGPLNYYENTGTPTIPEWTSRGALQDDGGSNINPGRANKLDFADYWDDDGDLDLAVGEEGGGINFYRNTGTKTNMVWKLEYEGLYDDGDRSAPEFADLNNDGLLDLIIGELDGTLNYRENKGTKSLPDYSTNIAGYLGLDTGDRSQPRFYDIDNDWSESSPSLITANNSDYEFKFLVNEGAEFVMKNSELSECGYENGEDGRLGLTIKANNTIIENSIFNNNYYGIFIRDSDNNQIINNNISNNYFGFQLFSSFNNQIINNSVFNNDFGIYLKSSNLNTLTNNNVFDNDYGIYLVLASNNNTIKNNDVNSNNFNGIYLYSSCNKNTIKNNIITNNNVGIFLESSNNNWISENNILRNFRGFYIYNATNNTCIENNISNNSRGIQLFESTNNPLINSKISDSLEYDFYFWKNSTITTINTTFDRDMVYFDDEDSELTVKWYFSLNVVDNNDFGVENADILIKNKFGDEEYVGKTSTDGSKNWIEITEYKEDYTGRTEYSPYNLSISRRATIVYQDINFIPPNNNNQILTINLPIVEEQFGHSVSYAGDLNNDGYDDIIVGAPYNDLNGFNAGAVYVFYGYSNFNSSDLNPENAGVILKGEEGSLFGWSVSNAGDVDNDGNEDIIIGAPEATIDGKRRGSVYFYNGKYLENNTYENANITITGRYEGDKFGTMVSDIGDINNDTFDDIGVIAYSYEIEHGLIGEYYDNNNFTNISGTEIDEVIDFDWGEEKAHRNMTDNDHFSIRWTGKIYCPSDDEYTFYIKANDRNKLKINNFQLILDISEDTEDSVEIYLTKGYHDIFIEMVELSGDANIYLKWESTDIPKQTITKNYLFHDYKSATTSIFYGPIDEKTARNASMTLPDNFLTSISSAGDINNDGYDDFVAGSNFDNKVYVYYGSDEPAYGITHVNLWDVEQDWESFEVDFTNGVYSVDNTFGAEKGDDGWDWVKGRDISGGLYGTTTQDMTTLKSSDEGIADGLTHDGSARLEVEVGGDRGTNDEDSDSGAWGIQVNITDDMYQIIQNGGRAILSFDWEAFDTEIWGTGEENGATEEECYVKARFGDIYQMNYLGRNTYGDSQPEIWGGDSYISWGQDVFIPFHEFGNSKNDVSRYINQSGNYYLELGAKFNADIGGWYDQQEHEGIRAYFDNVSLKIVHDTSTVIEGEGDFGFSVSSININNDSYDDIVVGAPGIGKTHVYYGSSEGVDYGLISLDKSDDFSTGTRDNITIGNGSLRIMVDYTKNIVPNGWFNNNWDNWTFTDNRWGDSTAQRDDTSNPNGMVTDENGDWLVSPQSGGPTAGFGSDRDSIGGGQQSDCTGMIKSDDFIIPNDVDYIHLWYHWKVSSFDSQGGADACYLNIFDASNDEVLISIREHEATSNGENWDEEEEVVTDISAFHGYSVYIGIEIRSNDGQSDQALAQIDDVYSCDSEGNPPGYLMSGDYTSEMLNTDEPIISVVPKWDAVLNDGDIVIKFRSNSSVSWDDAQIAVNNDPLIIDNPGKETQFKTFFTTTNNESSPFLKKISYEYFKNKIATTIKGNSEDKFGYSVSCAGDMNNDSIDDLIISAPFNDEKGMDSGSVYAFFGDEAFDIILDTNRAFGMYYGENENDNFGMSISFAGSINDDDYQMGVVGAPINSNENGKAYLIGMKNIDVGVMSIDNPLRNGFLTPGVEIDIDATIANFGTTFQNNIDVHLNITCLENSDNDYSDVINNQFVNIGQFKIVNFKWTVPQGYENENLNYIISVYTDLTGDMVDANNDKSIPTKARGHDVGMSCDEPNKSVRASESIDYFINIINTGNLGDDTIDLEVEFPTDWDAKFYYQSSEITHIDVNEGQYKEITLTVYTIENAKHGYEYQINITATSKNGFAFSELEVITRIKQTELEPIDLRFFRNDGVELSDIKHAIEDQDITINATIKNNGDTYATNVQVTFYENTVATENIISTTNVDIIYDGITETYAEVTWVPSFADYTIIVIVDDPDDQYLESNETNNIYSEEISIYSKIPQIEFIRWIKVRFINGTLVKNGLLVMKNLNTNETFENYTNDDGKCRFEVTNYTEGDPLMIIATNSEFESKVIRDKEEKKEKIPAGTFYYRETIYAYSDDSNDNYDSDVLILVLEQHGAMIDFEEDDIIINKGGFAHFKIYLKIPYEINDGNENVTINVDNLPSSWDYSLIGDGLTYINDEYRLNIYKSEWGIATHNIGFFVYPPNTIDVTFVNIMLSLKLDSYNLPDWYVEEYNPYSKYLQTTISVFKPSVEILDEENETWVNPGDTKIYSFDIKNEGNIRDTISLSFSGTNSNWASLSNSSFIINHGDSKIVYLTINVPENAKETDICDLRLWAVSKDGTRSKDNITKIYVYPKTHQITMEYETSVSVGNQTDYYIDIINSGDFPENVVLKVVTTKNWNGILNNTYFKLNVNSATKVKLSLTQLTEEWGLDDDVFIVANYGESNESVLILNKPPYAYIILRPTGLIQNQITISSTITTDSSYSKDEFPDELDFIWDFGDGSIISDEQPSHKYKKAGNYNISLTVMDNHGLTDITMREIIVTNYHSPTIKVIWSKDINLNLEDEIIEIEESETLVLDASQSFDEDGYIVKYSWDFGDNIVKEGNIIYWNYTDAGSYEIVLTVEDNFGKIKELIIDIEVKKREVTTGPLTEKDEGVDFFLILILLIIVIILIIIIVAVFMKVKKISKQLKDEESVQTTSKQPSEKQKTSSMDSPIAIEKDKEIPVEISKEEELEEEFESKREFFGPNRNKEIVMEPLIKEEESKELMEEPLKDEMKQFEKTPVEDFPVEEKPMGYEGLPKEDEGPAYEKPIVEEPKLEEPPIYKEPIGEKNIEEIPVETQNIDEMSVEEQKIDEKADAETQIEEQISEEKKSPKKQEKKEVEEDDDFWSSWEEETKF